MAVAKGAVKQEYIPDPLDDKGKHDPAAPSMKVEMGTEPEGTPEQSAFAHNVARPVTQLPDAHWFGPAGTQVTKNKLVPMCVVHNLSL